MNDALGQSQLAENGLCFYVRGERSEWPDLVLEHGGGGNAVHWAQLAPLLATHGRVFSYDRAGSGGSAADAQGHGAAATTQRLSRLVEQMGVRKPFVLAGYSLGGLYARHYAASHPQDVRALVLVDATPTGLEIRPGQLRRVRVMLWALHWLARSGVVPLWWNITRKEVSPALRRDLKEFCAPGRPARMVEELRATARIRGEVARLAPRLSHPTLALVAGCRPGMSAAETARLRDMYLALMNDAPAGSRMVEIAAADHGSILKDAAAVAQCAAQIREFVRGL